MRDIRQVYNTHKRSVLGDRDFFEMVFAKNAAYFAHIGVYVDGNHAPMGYLQHALAHDFIGLCIEIVAAQVCQLDKCYGVGIRCASFLEASRYVSVRNEAHGLSFCIDNRGRAYALFNE